MRLQAQARGKAAISLMRQASRTPFREWPKQGRPQMIGEDRTEYFDVTTAKAQIHDSQECEMPLWVIYLKLYSLIERFWVSVALAQFRAPNLRATHELTYPYSSMLFSS